MYLWCGLNHMNRVMGGIEIQIGLLLIILVEKNKIDLISTGNIEDDFNLVGDADWVVEAIVERINIKKGI